ncbi:MAG: hypothetical protein ACLFV3_05745 [Phycisphaeraceae bacterium]
MARRRVRKFVLIAALVVVALIAVAAAVVQGVLWSDLPRSRAEATLEELLGLDLEIGSLSVGWGGGSVARDITVSLPLADQPLLTIPTLDLTHTGVLALAAGQPLTIDEAELINPVAVAREAPDGRWNLQRAAEVVQAALARQPEKPGPTELPAVAVRQGTLRIEPAEGDPLELPDLAAVGRPGGDLAYRLDLDLPRVGDVAAAFARTPPYRHEVTFDLAPDPPLLARLADAELDFAGRGTWQGRVTDAGLRGGLSLIRAAVPGAEAKGRLELEADAATGEVRVRPGGLAVTIPSLSPDPLRIREGELLIDWPAVTVDALRVAGLEGMLAMEARADLAAQTGRLQAAWEDLVYPAGYAHQGEIDLTLRQRRLGGQRLEGEVTARGSGPDLTWRGDARLAAAGPSWRELAGELTARELAIDSGDRAWRFQDLAAAFATRAPRLEIRQIETRGPTPTGSLAGRGELNWNTWDWAGSLSGEQIDVPGAPEPLTQIEADLAGDLVAVRLENATLQWAGLGARASGAYQFGRPEPLRLDVAVQDLPLRLVRQQQPLLGARTLAGELAVAGRLQPLELRAVGELVARSVRLRQSEVGDVALQVTGSADAELARVRAEATEWLGGQWQLSLTYALADQAASLEVDARDLDLALVDQLFEQPVGGLGRFDLNLSARDLGPDPARWRMAGEFAGRRVIVRPVMLAEVAGNLSLSDGRLRVTDLRAAGDGGKLEGELSVPVNEPTHLTLAAKVTDWPWRVEAGPALAGRVSGRTRAELDLASLTGRGRLAATGSATLAGDPLTQFDADVVLAGDRVLLNSLTGDLLGGTITGEGVAGLGALKPSGRAGFDLWVDVARDSRLMLSWQGGEPSRLAPLWEELGQVAGTVSGSLRLAEAEDPRALGPMRLDATIDAKQIAYQNLPLGEGDLLAWLGRERIVLEQVEIQALDGYLRGRGRLSTHDDERFAYVRGEVEHINLALLSDLLDREEPIVGRLSAAAALTGPFKPEGWREAQGSGTLQLRESDLAALPLFASIFDLLNLRFGSSGPDGRGEGRFRLEEGGLLMERFSYRNRGTDLRIVARLLDVWEGGESPVRGYVLASFQPLPDVEVLDLANRALGALQSQVTAVRLRGTLTEPEVEFAPLRGVTGAIGRLLGGGDDGEEEEGEALAP